MRKSWLGGGARVCLVAALFMMIVVAPISAHGGQSVRWGYIDRQGTVVIAPTFGEAHEFHSGLAAVWFPPQGSDWDPRELLVIVGGRWGFLDKTGKMVIGPRPGTAFEFSEGIASVLPNPGNPQIIDTGGKIALARIDKLLGPEAQFKTRLYDIGPFHDGLASVFTADSGGMITGSGPQFTNVHAGYIDRSGHVAIPLKYSGAGDFSEGMAPVCVDGKWGYVDILGKLVIQAKYDRADSFSEGLAFVKSDDIWGFIDHTDRMVLQPKAPLAPVLGSAFHEGLVPVASEDRFGFMDRSGRIVIEPKYADALSFSEGLAPVKLPEGQWAYIDAMGNVVIRPQWHNALAQQVDEFSEGLAAVGFSAPGGR
jgi:hypothetical protein